MPNERVTEEIVRDHFKAHSVNGQKIEEQQSDDPRIKRALARASKSGSGIGKPEFIITIAEEADFVIVIECKFDAAKHVSAAQDQPAVYAVDGVLLYASHLARDFDVVAIAVSGSIGATLKVSTFRQLRGASSSEPLVDEFGDVTTLRSTSEYRRLLTFDPAVRLRTQAELMAFSRQLHNYMRDYAKLSENEKPLAVSATLLALRDHAFKATWRKYRSTALGRELLHAIQREVEAAVPETMKQNIILQPYQFLETHPELNRQPRNQVSWPLRSLVEKIEEHVRPFIDTYHDFDIIGQFYGEFLRYTGGDKKALGIVLTPRHLTELFAKMANVGPSDTILDTCAGTGGFLISALSIMDARVGADEAAREAIRQHQLVGVEQQPHMFALASSNMILRGDGKANLYQGSCFDPDIIAKLKSPDPSRHKRPNIGLINPPFSQKGEGLHELDFVVTLLDILEPSGTAVVVLPMSCAIEPHPARERLLRDHTLVASVSLPNDLFHPVGVIACALVLKAHQPHQFAPMPTWFGLWKQDGFVKLKERGRVDPNNRWSAIRDTWLSEFHSRAVIPGHSVTRSVTHVDEWTAEAYLEADYQSLGMSEFNNVLRQYAMFEALYGSSDEVEQEGDE